MPKSTLEAMRTDRDAIIAAKNDENTMLKEAYKMSEKARLVESESNAKILELGQTTVRLLRSIHDKANEVRNDMADEA